MEQKELIHLLQMVADGDASVNDALLRLRQEPFEILICCGQTCSQLPHPIHAPGCFSSGTAIRAIGAIKPPPVNACSLYKSSSIGISRFCGQ